VKLHVHIQSVWSHGLHDFVRVNLALSLDHGDDDDIDEDGETNEVVSGMIDCGAILIAVIIIVLVTSVNDWSKDRKFRSLQNKIDDSHLLTVLRDKAIVQIQVANLVVGDICMIKYGEFLHKMGRQRFRER
jgi:P-type Ca2+ transporter type 2B